jgi:hypothetical protein
MADCRALAVTQVLENIAYRCALGCDTMVLADFSRHWPFHCAMAAI